MRIDITVNGEPHSLDVESDTPLLYVIRNDLGLKGTRFGCGQGSCGSCMVLIDGEPVNSCDLPISEVGERPIRTVEDSSGGSTLAILQRAFVDEQAAQCGYCTSGILMSACALLEGTDNPSREEVCAALDGNFCRCGTHTRMVKAVERAAGGLGSTPLPLPRSTRIAAPSAGGVGNDHLSVLGDGTVQLRSGKVDIGQGITTALAQIAATELGVSIERIRVVRTDTSLSPNEGMTAGSFSVQKGGTAIREAAVALRARLLTLATEDLGSTATELTVEDGTVTAPTGESITYWELAGGSDTLTVTSTDRATADAAIQRFDLPAKLTGQPSFIQDLELDGMLHARVVRPPTHTASLADVEVSSTLELEGIVNVVRSGSFLAVVSEREEQAIRGARRLFGATSWNDTPGPAFDPGDARYLLDSTDIEVQVAAEPAGASDPVDRVSATYTRGYLAHASIGPSCAIGLMEDGELTIWTHSQGVFPLRDALAEALRMTEDHIRVIHVEGAGCYGHNGADDVALDAALIARDIPGRPIRLQWSREDEFGWEPYSSAMVMELGAGLDDSGSIVEWSHRGWSHPHSSRPGNSGGVNLLAATHMEEPIPATRLRPIPLNSGGGMLRNSVPPYDVGSADISGNFVPEGPVRTSALRGLATHPNTFAIESFMDELAARTGSDPVEYRLRHLSDPRAREVIETVVSRAGVPVGGQDDRGRGYGIGFGRYKNLASYVAVIAEVEAEREVRLVRAWAVVDAGMAVSPDGIANQIEGGIVQSASWALKEQIRFVDGRPELKTWLDYPILGFSETPVLDVHVIDRPDEPSVGVGEGAQGPATAAIANAVRAVLGVPVRDLPLTPDRIMSAILA
jgi:CO/xanthine dehydrogenase Mo-binding subunit/aerobic-type carbon monoxide dehydrogenase small subunit (CoxS/CutS family)